jgi:hypothetical protein
MCKYLALLVFSLAIPWLSGCGDSGSHRGDAAPTKGSFIAEVEHRCNVVYPPPSVKGDALGYTCGETTSGAHFGATFTRRPRCLRFMTLVDTDRDRFQQCLAAAPSSPRGAVFCRNNLVVLAARTLPRIQSATVLLSTGQKLASQKILALNTADRERLGGFFFDVLASRIPTSAVLVEHDQGGRIVRHLQLVPVPGCPSAARGV